MIRPKGAGRISPGGINADGKDGGGGILINGGGGPINGGGGGGIKGGSGCM